MSSDCGRRYRAARARAIRRPAIALVAAVILGVAGTAGRAHAQAPCGPTAKYGPTATVAGGGAAPANDTFINPTAGKSHAYFTQNTALYCYLNAAEGGTPVGQPCPGWPGGGWHDSTSLSNFPNPVVLSKDAVNMNNTAEYLFATTQDGYLYKVDANTGLTVGSGVLIRRRNQ